MYARDMDHQIRSQAIIAYLGKGRSAFPRSDADAVLTLATDTGLDANELLASVRAVVDECMAIKVNWSNNTLPEGGDDVKRVLATRHLELSDDALAALRWAFTYNWR